MRVREDRKRRFVVGKEAVPIKNTITLQGGLHGLESGALEFIAAEDGNTLSKTPQPVPGGLAGLFRCYEISNFLERIACEVVFENGLTGVNAITELAAPAKSIEFSLNNLFSEEGIALSLPVKVRLENAFLGSSCYIGSRQTSPATPHNRHHKPTRTEQTNQRQQRRIRNHRRRRHPQKQLAREQLVRRTSSRRLRRHLLDSS